MPHSRKNLKLTGDTHPPEVEDDLGAADEERRPRAATPARARATAAGTDALAVAQAPPPRAMHRVTPTGRYLEAARGEVHARPLIVAAAAFFAGFAIAVITRSR
jgi:hypothetical protein